MQTRPFGNTGFHFAPLGIGTVWFGRRWPTDNKDYAPPSKKEILVHMNHAMNALAGEGSIMVDTARAYGTSEEVLGEFFRRNGNVFSKSFIATKWGENFDPHTEQAQIEHTTLNLERSLERSGQYLPRIDLLYMHLATPESIADKDVVGEMMFHRDSGNYGINLLGFSTSNPATLEAAVHQSLMDPFDAIQIPADLFYKQQDIVRAIHESGRAIVVNSPIRKQKDKNPREAYLDLLRSPYVSMVLTGTRNHLDETISYLNDLK